MKLLYHKQADKWHEALPVGNGKLGGMVYGRVNNEIIQLNEDSIWSGKPLDRINPDAYKNLPEIRRLLRCGEIEKAEQLSLYALAGVPNSQRSYQTAGECRIHFNGSTQAEDYSRELDLDEGIVRVYYKVQDTVYTREIFTSYPDDIMVIRLKAEGALPLSFDVRLERCHNWNDEIERSEDADILMSANTGEGAISFTTGVRADITGGSKEIIGETLIIKDVYEATIYITIQSSFREKDYKAAVNKKLVHALKKGYEVIKQSHREDYGRLFGRVKLSLGEDIHAGKPVDERLMTVREGGTDAGLIALYFQYGRYLLIASSREGALPANLQGIWNDSLMPPWDSKYTININTEMNYWIAEGGNIPECHLPLFEHLDKVKENGKKTAAYMYGCAGSVAHHNTDIYADTAPQDLWVPSTMWVMGEAWLATHIWEHYQYTQDREFLDRYFDILEQSVLFFYDFLIEGKDGTLVTSPSISPENTYRMENGTEGRLCEGPAMDTEILMELLTDYIDACVVLRKEQAQIDKAKETLSRLPELKIGKHGQLQEWMEDYDEPEPGHRHISHLFSVYPGSALTWEDTPELMKAAKISLERRLENGGGHTGWSRAWIIGLWARFGNGQLAYENLTELLKQSTFPNLMDNHPAGDGHVFQIDGNMGAAAALIEMLVQCNGSRMKLLPAVPEDLKTGSVQGICLRGGMVLDMKWEDGKVSELAIVSKADKKIELIVNGYTENIVITKEELFTKEYNE